MLYYNPTFDKECPPWLYISYALGLFLYQTFDACDGLQARRTGQSGPLGELFDHCVDALNTTLEVLIFASVTNMGYGWSVVASQFATLLNFYMSTWEEYHTGTLFLSAFSGPVEGILIVVAIFTITAFTGPQFWHSELFSLLNNNIIETLESVHELPDIVKHMTLIDVYLVFAGVGLIFNIQAASSHVLAARAKKNLPFLPAIYELIPFLFFFGTLMVWILISPTILYGYLLPLAFATGIISAFTVGRIITAHVTSQKFPLWNPLLFMPSIGIAVNILSKLFGWDETLSEVAAVWAGLGLSIGVYGSFIAEIIVEITTYLDIGCLYIKHPNVDKVK
ncbi:diacylglycerol cholinephosphotransferase [Sugiyamaella lignohabitans]|uniref:Diacylglycerol cholinephosphotransferase n=1 Tax=Sugiyamaella lignohabitans TaxID=796027 RepID=A0A161HK96_9ASCO|nr:diacylglycerol cholinephosphotransferase [Sugiyamaella lignohabitans]ANB13357.1 diacylglycerol cholinephosphotransferase [Sugiyamaella lignohabitans]